MTKKKKRNPQDATRRNVQAANKKIAKLEKKVSALHVLVSTIHCELEDLKGRDWL